MNLQSWLARILLLLPRHKLDLPLDKLASVGEFVLSTRREVLILRKKVVGRNAGQHGVVELTIGVHHEWQLRSVLIELQQRKLEDFIRILQSSKRDSRRTHMACHVEHVLQ
jgi:hypothetical protein